MSTDHTLAFESALAELIDLVSPGLESGHLLDDAKTAAAQAYELRARVQALIARNGELVDMIERLCNGLENYRNTSPWGDDDEDVLTEAREMAAGLDQLPSPGALTRPAWRTGAPGWTDDDSIRVIAVTADDEFAGVQFHDIKASDFHLIDEGGEEVGTEVTRLCTHWVYRDELLPIVAAPVPREEQPANTTAETWLRTKYGAYRGHPEWRALEAAFNAGMAAQIGGA